MRVGINSVFLQKPTVGMGLHVRHLLHGLNQLAAHDMQYVPLTPRFHQAFGPRGENLERLWWEQAGVTWAGVRQKIDVLHSPYWSSPLWAPFPTIVTIHDVIQFVLPEYRYRAASRLYFDLVSRAARRAAAIIAVSECSKRDIVHHLRVPAERIRVIGNAVDASVQRVTDESELTGVRERYGIGPRFVLYFGGFDSRKNVPRIIQAYARLPEPIRAEYQLVLAGGYAHLGHPMYPDPRLTAAELGMLERVVFTGQVREGDKAALFSAATVFCFPSLYEGFGLPVLENMACGTPVVTSNSSALPEVVGDAAVIVDPYDVDAIGHAVLELLESPARRAELSQRGQARARQFTWSQVAERTQRLYVEVAAG